MIGATTMATKGPKRGMDAGKVKREVASIVTG